MDNSTEFKKKVLALLKRHHIHVINGSPYHPNTQGSVEKANYSSKRKLRAAQLSKKPRIGIGMRRFL